MRKQSKKKVNTEDIKHQLFKEFLPKHKIESKSQIIRELYNKYNYDLTQPRLTYNNLVRVIRYIKRNHLYQSQYNQAIQHVQMTKSALTINDFRHIYDYIVNKRHLQMVVTKKKLVEIYRWIVQFVKHCVSKNYKVYFYDFGIFSSRKIKSSKYTLPNSTKQVKVPKHIIPKFKPSHEWKKELRNHHI